MTQLLIIFALLFAAGCATGYADSRRAIGSAWGQAEVASCDLPCVEDPNGAPVYGCPHISGGPISLQFLGAVGAVTAAIAGLWYLSFGALF